MSKWLLKKLLITFICIIIFIPKNQLFSQTKDELENKKQKIQEEIALTNKLLGEIQQKEKNSIEEYNLKNEKISLRNNYIKEINYEINDLDEQMIINQKEIDSLNAELKSIRDEYAKLIYIAYKNRYTENPLMFILAATTLNQAYKRIKYIQEYSEYRKDQAKKIEDIIDLIKKKNIKISQSKEQKNSLLSDVQKEKSALQKDIDEQKNLISQLKNKEDEVRKELMNKQKIADQLEKEIANFVKAEMSKGNASSFYNRLTPQEKVISNEFSANMGKLPWPTSQGVITGKFGRQPHPVVKGVIVDNHGIDITTVKDADVRCIFDGVVTRILTIMGSSYTVIVRHGNYLSVYHNLAVVYVKQGEMVKMKQVIGRVKDEPNSNAAVLHVELWKEQEILNPEKWLSN